MARYDCLIFGLTWRTSISDDRNELLAYSKELDANCYVEAAFDIKHKYGLINLKKIEKAQSAAMVLGQMLDGGNGIFIHQLNRDEHCFIAVRDTLPVEGCDIVGTREKVIQAAKAYADNARKKEGTAPKFYGDAIEISGATVLEIAKLVEEADDIGQLKRVRSLNKRAVFVGAFALLMAATWFAPDLANLGAPKQTSRIDPKEEHRKAVKLAIDQIVAQRQFPINVMPGYVKFVSSFPAEVAMTYGAERNKGWKLEKIVCVETDCTADWKRQGSATNKEFLDALNIASGDVSVSFPSVDVISRKVTFNKSETEDKLILGTQLKLGETVLSWLQTLNDRPRTDPMTPLVPAASSISSDPADMPLIGSYAFTVPYKDLEKVASLPSALTIERSTLTYQDGQNIKIEFQGKYYAL